jgi:hypothetical protein
MRIWLGKGQLPDGRKHYNLGLHIYEDEGIEVRKVIKAVEGSLAKHFPNTGVTESKAVRELLMKP